MIVTRSRLAPKELPCQFGSEFGDGHQTEFELGGAPFKGFEDTLAVLLLVVFGSNVDVFFSVFEHVVDDLRQFVGRRRDRFGGSQSGFHATVECAKGTIRTGKRLGGQSQNARGPVGAGSGFAADQTASGFLVARTKTQPRREMFLGGPMAA